MILDECVAEGAAEFLLLFSLSFFAPKFVEGNDTKKMPIAATFLCRCLQTWSRRLCKPGHEQSVTRFALLSKSKHHLCFVITHAFTFLLRSDVTALLSSSTTKIFSTMVKCTVRRRSRYQRKSRYSDEAAAYSSIFDDLAICAVEINNTIMCSDR